MYGQKLAIISATGAILLNPLAMTALASSNVPVPETQLTQSQTIEIAGETATPINKPTSTVTENGQTSLTKNPDSVGEVTLQETKQSLESIDGLLKESSEINGGTVEISRSSNDPTIMESEGVSLKITLKTSSKSITSTPSLSS